tara:strand:+ start:357 stop:773 length:417 start_codon:yes stop_codon:yes gene_type:complete
MKKLLGIVVLGLLWSNIAFAGCLADLDRKLTWKDNNVSVEWQIKNKTKNSIVITTLGLWASDNKTVMKEDTTEYYIKPFGVRNITVWFGDINLDDDIRGSFFTGCKYGTTTKKTTKTKKYKKPEKSGAKKLLEKIFGN